MNKYTKPTISLLSLNATSSAASSCSVSGVDLDEVYAMLEIMGIPKDNAFGMGEDCAIPVETYCKFTSTIQVFNS